MRVSIVNDFKYYQKLMFDLDILCFQYKQLLSQKNVMLHNERALNEAMSDKEKAKMDYEIGKIKAAIDSLIITITKHLARMNGHLENESVALQKSEVDEINSDHVDAMESYEYCTSRIATLKKRHENWTFSEISFVELDKKKMLLNIAIKNYNDKNLRLMNYKLLDIFEALKVAKEQLL